MTVQATQPTPLDPRAWREMTPVQRLILLDRILVRHQRFNRIMEEIDYCNLYACEISSSNPPCLVILGETGAGKTTLARTWIADSGLRRQETPEGSIIPYLYVSIPARATIKTSASNFLEALGDPNPSRGTHGLLVLRLYHLIKECRIKIIFVDEFQHIYEREKHSYLYSVADFLKDIINHTRVPMVLIGRLGEAESILGVNPQLDRLMGSPLILEPFAWNRKKVDTTVTEFCDLMNTLDQALPFDLSGLSTEDMAFRFYYATNGYLGHIMDLIRHAAHGAIHSGCATLNLPLLEAAYNRCIRGTIMGRGKDNPFTPGFDESGAKVVIPAPDQPPLPGPTQARATTSRGQWGKHAGRASKQSTSEVLKKS